MDFVTRFRERSMSFKDKKKIYNNFRENHEKRITWMDENYRRRALSSPASDLAARRGVFSRRHYGSVELLNSAENEGAQLNAGRFRVETGERDKEEVSSPMNSPIHLENPEFQTRWYFKYYLGKLHQNYVGLDSDKEPFLLSVINTDANNHNVPQYRAILWTKTGAKRICLPYNPSKPQTVKGILSHFDLDRADKGPKEIFSPEIQKELLVLEEQEGSVNFKFGVIFAKEGQTSDDEFYSNEHGNEHFENFVKLLGDRVKLKGWEKFKAGLDVKSNTTGDESIYTVYEGHEIMFHISTMLPHSKENKQQVERKRHVGNDIVNIVFVECDNSKTPSFKPSMMKTRFTHIFAVVTYNTETFSYRLNVFSEESVPLFGPPLPSPPEFYNHQEFRDFLLVKLINGEKAAVNNPVFTQKRERTLEMLIKSLYQEYTPENNMLNRRAFSDVIQDVHTSRGKEEARRSEFVRVGQTLKLKTIIKGNAPTSQYTTGLLKREPWEPQLCHTDVQFPITAADSWGDKLVICNEASTMLLEDGLVSRALFDKTVNVKQINIVETHGILILRTDKGKDGRIYVFRLLDFEGEANESIVRTKPECKDRRLEKAKGCHMYAISRPGSSHLRMVVAVGKRLLVFHWKHTTEWMAWYPAVDLETTDGFNLIRELEAFETPQLLTLVDCIKGDNQICVGYKNQFDLINEKNGDTLQLFHIDTVKCNFAQWIRKYILKKFKMQKNTRVVQYEALQYGEILHDSDNAKTVNLVSAVDIYEDEEPELLLTYNHVSHFQKLTEETTTDFDIHWNSEPLSIVCAFPYVMAFTQDTIEIRLIINGNLVHTMTMPDTTLITSKCDIFFATVVVATHSPKEKSFFEKENTPTPPASPSFRLPPSPTSKTACLKNIYKIPITCLTGQIPVDRNNPNNTRAQQTTLLAPVSGNGDRSPASPSTHKRSPLLRTKCLHSSDKQEKERNDSSSSDSGIMILRTSEFSPPGSPCQYTSTCQPVFAEKEAESDIL